MALPSKNTYNDYSLVVNMPGSFLSALLNPFNLHLYKIGTISDHILKINKYSNKMVR